VLGVVLFDPDRGRRHRERDLGALEGGVDALAHPGAYGVVAGEIGQPVADRVVREAIAVLHGEVAADAVRLRRLRGTLDRRYLEGLVDCLDDVGGAVAEIDVEIDPHPVLERLAFALAEDHDRAREERGIGHDQGVPITRLDHRVPPANLAHPPLPPALELHPVADLDRGVELQGDTADDVAERALERECGDRGEQGAGRDDAGEFEARPVQRQEGGDDVPEANRQISDDGCEIDPERRQAKVEDGEGQKAHERDRPQELGDLTGRVRGAALVQEG
jgi:hypothetical protein